MDGREFAIGNVFEIDGRFYVLTSKDQAKAKYVDRTASIAGKLDDFLNSHRDLCFLRVVKRTARHTPHSAA